MVSLLLLALVGNGVLLGLVGYSQTAAYPLLGALPPELRATFHDRHSRGITVWAGAGFLGTLAGAAVAARHFGSPAAWVVLVAALGVALSTAAAVRLHEQISRLDDADPGTVLAHRLLRANGWRLVSVLASVGGLLGLAPTVL